MSFLELFEFSSACDLGWAVIKDDALSYSYALPNKLFEYAVCGVPSLASSLPNLDLYVNKYNLELNVRKMNKE